MVLLARSEVYQGCEACQDSSVPCVIVRLSARNKSKSNSYSSLITPILIQSVTHVKSYSCSTTSLHLEQLVNQSRRPLHTLAEPLSSVPSSNDRKFGRSSINNILNPHRIRIPQDHTKLTPSRTSEISRTCHQPVRSHADVRRIVVDFGHLLIVLENGLHG